MYNVIDDQQDFLIVSKKQGVCVHSEDGKQGLIGRLKEDLNSQKVYLVHRLDKVTSGLLIIAKNQPAASELSQLFQNRQIQKYYLAISDHKPKKKQGLVRGDMERARRGAWKLSRSNANPAITQFYSYGANNGISKISLKNDEQRTQVSKKLFILKPHTGKTHQLRVALRSLGSPIISDHLYGGRLYLEAKSEAETLSGIFLHAYGLCFSYQQQDYTYLDEPTHWHDFLGGALDSVVAPINVPAIKKPWELSWPFYKK